MGDNQPMHDTTDDRTPIFNTADQALAYYTECALATAERLDMIKSSSQSEKRRAWNIANGMVRECIRHKVSLPSQFAIPSLPRLRKLMEPVDVG